MRHNILRALGLMALVGMGLGADLTLVGRDLVLFLLGPKWMESGRLFTLFGPGIGVMLLYFTHVWIHLSIGRADRWFRWGLVDLLVTSVALLTGLRWGAEGIALAWVASYWIITLPALWYAGKPIGLGGVAILAAVWRQMLASLLAGAATWAVQHWLLTHSPLPLLAPLIRVLAVSAVFCAAYMGATALLYGSFRPFTELNALFHQIRRKHAVAQPPEEPELAACANSCQS